MNLAVSRGVDHAAVVKTNPYPSTRVLGAMIRADDDKAVDYVLGMLKEYFGNVTHAVKAMGIGERTLYDWANEKDGNARLMAALSAQRGDNKLRAPLRGPKLELELKKREARRSRRRKA